MVIEFLPRKIAKEIDFITSCCTDKKTLASFNQDRIDQHWAYIFRLACKIPATDKEKDAIFEELAIAYDVNMILVKLTQAT